MSCFGVIKIRLRRTFLQIQSPQRRTVARRTGSLVRKLDRLEKFWKYSGTDGAEETLHRLVLALSVAMVPVIQLSLDTCAIVAAINCAPTPGRDRIQRQLDFLPDEPDTRGNTAGC